MVKQIYYDGIHQRMHGIKVHNESIMIVLFVYSRLSNFSAIRRLPPLPVKGLQN